MATHMRATTGQPVLVCVDTIKADKRDEYRRHIDQIKAPAVSAVKAEVHVSVRLLEPAGPNPDGTWTFIWLMDPCIEGEDYEMLPMYETYYGSDRAATLLRDWDDCYAVEQVCHEMVQTEW